jgi:hypothetical protein
MCRSGTAVDPTHSNALLSSSGLIQCDLTPPATIWRATSRFEVSMFVHPWTNGAIEIVSVLHILYNMERSMISRVLNGDMGGQ